MIKTFETLPLLWLILQKKNKPEAIFFLDSGARLAANLFKSAYRARFPMATTMPKLLFLNPVAFLSQELVSETKPDEDFLVEFLQKEKKAILRGEIIATQSERLKLQEILEQLEHTYQLAGLRRDSKVLLFDTCCHSGSNLLPVLSVFRAFGADPKIALANDARLQAELKPDLVCLDHEPEHHPVYGGCYPFGLTNRYIMRKSTHSIHCSPDPNATKHYRNYRNDRTAMKKLFDQG